MKKLLLCLLLACVPARGASALLVNTNGVSTTFSKIGFGLNNDNSYLSYLPSESDTVLSYNSFPAVEDNNYLRTGPTANVNAHPHAILLGPNQGFRFITTTANPGASSLFLLNTYEKMRLTPSGELWLGSQTGNAKLDVYGSAVNTAVFRLRDSSVSHGIGYFASDDTFFNIGRSSSAGGGAYLTGLSDDGLTPGVIFQAVHGVTDPSDSVAAFLLSGSKRSGASITALGALETVLQVGNGLDGATKLMTILGSGNVGIGTTTPATPLDVNGIINSASGYRIASAATSGNYLRGNGTEFVSSALQIGDLPTVTLAKGGTSKNITAAAGGIVWTDSDSMEVTVAGTSGYFVRSGGTTTPTFYNLFGSANTFSATQTILDGKLSVTDSDVSHGVTSYLPDSALFYVQFYSSTAGGGIATGANDDGAEPGLMLQGIHGVTSPTTTVPAILLAAGKKNGTSVQALASTETAWEIKSGGESGTSIAKGMGNGDTTFAGSLVWGGGTAIKGNPAATASLDFGSVGAQSHLDLTIAVTGAVANDSVVIGEPASATTGIKFSARVSASDTVTVRAHNYTGSSVDPSSGTFRVTVLRY